jgi:hypothetical protein
MEAEAYREVSAVRLEHGTTSTTRNPTDSLCSLPRVRTIRRPSDEDRVRLQNDIQISRADATENGSIAGLILTSNAILGENHKALKPDKTTLE